jgi:putative NIF3 family GTP cyclohydrolase 1 type 2
MGRGVKAREIRDYILERAPWVRRGKTVDTFKIGDPNIEVRRVAVLWMLTTEAIEQVRRLGANLVVTHEPTFFTHVDDVSVVEGSTAYQHKRNMLEEAALTVLRIHDSWDPWPKIGIGDSLATLLGLGKPVAAARDGLGKTYGIAPVKLDRLAQRVAHKVGMESVSVAGDGERIIRRVALAYGSQCGPGSMQWFAASRADVVVAGELGQWQDVRFYQDSGVAIIQTDHAVSENPGLRNLAKFIRRQFKVPVDFIEVGAPFRAVDAPKTAGG